MVTALLLAMVARGLLPWGWGLVVLLIWAEPVVASPTLLVAIGVVIHHRRGVSRAERAAIWLRTAASELRAGSSLRSAIVAAVAAVPELELGASGRLAMAGRPLSEVSHALALIPELSEAGAAIDVASETGGSVAEILELLGNETADEAALIRETRSLTVGARWSIGLVGGFPLVVLVIQVVRGEVGATLSAGPIGTVMVVSGVALLLTGLAVVWMLFRRSRL